MYKACRVSRYAGCDAISQVRDSRYTCNHNNYQYLRDYVMLAEGHRSLPWC